MGIEIHDLTFSYGRRSPVLTGLNLTVEDGLVALLGENGAGKSTLLRILATEIPPRRRTGTVIIDGEELTRANLGRIRSRLGWVPQDFPFDGQQKVADAIAAVAWLRGMPRRDIPEAVNATLGTVDLADRADEKLKNLSGGLRRRAVIAAGLVHHPRTLLLDEPTAGLDPRNRKHTLRILRDIADRGILVLLSTHLAVDAEACERVLFLAEGHVLEDRPTAEFLERHGSIDAAFTECTGGDA